MAMQKIIILEVNNNPDSETLFDTTLNLTRQLNNDYPTCTVEYHGLIENQSRLGQSVEFYCDAVKCSVIIMIGGIGHMSNAVIKSDAAYKPIHPKAVDAVCSKVSHKIELNELLKFAVVRGKTLILNLPWCGKLIDECIKLVTPILATLHELAVVDSFILRPVEFSSLFPFGSPKHSNHRDSIYPILDVVHALDVLKNTIKKYTVRQVTKIPSEYAFGYVCAEDVPSSRMIPSSNMSTKDGYACLANDGLNLRTGIDENFRSEMYKTLPPNACYFIEKGESVLHEADCVIQMDDADILARGRNGKTLLRPKKMPEKYDNIKLMGSEVDVDEVVISKGVIIGDIEIGILYAIKQIEVAVYTKPCVAVISVGSDLRVASEFDLNNIHIRMACISQIKKIFFMYDILCNDLGLIPKNLVSILEAIKLASRNNDVIIFTAREYTDDSDYIRMIILDHFYAEVIYERINMAPGDRTTFGTLIYEDTLKFFFIMSSDLLSALVTCHVIIMPSMTYWSGMNNYGFSVINVCITEDIPLTHRPKYLFGTLTQNTIHNHGTVQLMKIHSTDLGIPHYNYDLVLELPMATRHLAYLRRGTLVRGLAFPKY